MLPFFINGINERLAFYRGKIRSTFHLSAISRKFSENNKLTKIFEIVAFHRHTV